jgi:hypothetical protein
MPRPASKVADEVAARARSLNAYVDRLERLYGRRELGRPDLNRAYAGALIAFHTYVERSLERLFLGLVMRRFTRTGVRPLVVINSERVARAVVNGGRRYVDWLPYEQLTLPRAEAFLSKGHPFVDLEKDDRRSLENLRVIRNALAHESSHALRMFRQRFTEGKALPPDQVTPTGYLRGRHAGSQSRLAFMLTDTVHVFARLCG